VLNNHSNDFKSHPNPLPAFVTQLVLENLKMLTERALAGDFEMAPKD
jgi:hypothetical protein